MKLFGFLALACLCLAQMVASEKLINCYWGTWANYRPGDGKFEPSNIDPNLCTHISYTFFGISDDGEFQSLDEWLDMDNGLGFISKTIALKQQNPKLKVLAVVGGWNEGSIKYSAMAADPVKRAKFVSSSLDFIQKHGFDGLDLDWEYPAQRGGADADRENFVTLLREIKETYDKYGLELGIAVGASEASAILSYDIPAISQHLTFINVMTYDFHMALDGYLGLNAPLPEVQQSIDYWLSAGAPPEKLILGIGFYGHSYQMSDSSQNWPGASCIGPGSAGAYTRESGFLGYHEICQNNWQTVFDEETSSPYAFQGDQWIGYDNPASIELKMQLVESRNLGGAMMWSIETDDFRGLCGESYPLLKAMNRAMGKEVNDNGNGNNGGNDNGNDGGNDNGNDGGNDNGNDGGNGNDNGNGGGSNCSSDGTFLHSSDCRFYYQCVGGIRYDFDCGEQLHFDPSTNICNWPSETNCPY
ncbi:acidic mammalian chitinase [Drosophila tropicalis]|uniref:acidic mammalian chitinase n=1 Tax=Drosophila tropicalis TaxID=46794 RepID=UPI0035ABE703